MIFKKYRIILCLLSLISCGQYLQAQQYDLTEVNGLVDYYLEHNQLISAFNLLTNASEYYLDQENFSVSYELKRRCCLLLDEHIDEFYDYGLTQTGYFEHWYVAISLARRLQRTDEAVPFLLYFLRKLEMTLPEMLPYYADELAYIIGECRDDSYKDSVYILQNALNVIKQESITKEHVIQYNKISKEFIANRFINSLNNEGHLVENKISEIEKWYLNNRKYVCSLDTSKYKAEILEYELEYIDMLMFFAQTISAQNKEYDESNELYKKAIDILQSLLALNDTLSQKIAGCNAAIGRNYWFLHDYAMCREYSDRAFGVLFNHKEDFDYCDIIDVLALNYYESGQFKLAAALRLREIIVRAKLGWHHTKSDWSTYFLYELSNHQPEKILEYKDIALYFSEESTPVTHANLLLHIGKAYTMLMDSITDYKDSAEFYLISAGNHIDSYKDSIERNESYADHLRSLYAAWAYYYQKTGQFQESYEYEQKALQVLEEFAWNNYVSGHFSMLAQKSTYLCDTSGLHKYLPRFYYALEKEIIEALPVLGEIESSNYLVSHGRLLYQIPEWASWNSTDEISCSVAYDAALLMKGLLLSHIAHISQMGGDSNLSKSVQRLGQLHDSIYGIADDTQRWQALHQYEQLERKIIAETNKIQFRVHWKDIQRGLHTDESCIEFVKYYKNGYAWSNAGLMPHYAAIVLSNDSQAPSFVDLFDEEELFDAYNLQPKSYDTELGKALYTKIWGKLQQYMDGKDRVFFSPMGLLNLMNIELLTDSMGQTALQRFNLYRVSSTKNVIFPSNEHKPTNAVSFGDIDYDNAQIVLDSLNTRGNWSYLKNTQYEINRLKELFSENNISITANVGKGATEALFKALDGTNADIIHVASHGYYIPRGQREAIPYFANSESTKNVQDELFYSGLIMSGGQKAWTDSTFGVDINDGILTAYEISKLDLHNVNLVVLSACETGLGDDMLDGIFGLQRAFKKAGVESILMSLWKIDDKATSEFMDLFYEKLVKGYSKHESYTYATHTMKEKYQDANYWASFVLLD